MRRWMLLEESTGGAGLRVSDAFDQGHPCHSRSVVTMVDDDNDPAVLIAGDPDDDARIWLLVDRVSRTDRVDGDEQRSHGVQPRRTPSRRLERNGAVQLHDGVEVDVHVTVRDKIPQADEALWPSAKEVARTLDVHRAFGVWRKTRDAPGGPGGVIVVRRGGS
jgi:hypothetical protein